MFSKMSFISHLGSGLYVNCKVQFKLALGQMLSLRCCRPPPLSPPTSYCCIALTCFEINQESLGVGIFFSIPVLKKYFGEKLTLHTKGEPNHRSRLFHFPRQQKEAFILPSTNIEWQTPCCGNSRINHHTLLEVAIQTIKTNSFLGNKNPD